MKVSFKPFSVLLTSELNSMQMLNAVDKVNFMAGLTHRTIMLIMLNFSQKPESV